MAEPAHRIDANEYAYRAAPQVTRQRMYLETLGEVLPAAGAKFIVDDDLEGVLPLLNLGGGPLLGPAQQGGQQ